jgi:O-antigen/teichoic acid export membrane protein
MARLRHFVHSILSGYLLLGMNVAYTLASIPLALAYLPTAEFGVWAITSQLVLFLAMLDFGLGAVIVRLLVDYKDRKQGIEYGSFVQTVAIVNTAQGLAILALAAGLALFAAPMLNIPVEQESTFRWLVRGQGLVLAIQFASRIFGNLLLAHQRSDLGNYVNCISLCAAFVILWIGFAAGAGVLSLLWSQIAGACITALLAFVSCRWLGLLPTVGNWGRPRRACFNDLFEFGWKASLYLIGNHIIYVSPTLIVTKALGLEAAAAWSICARPFLLILQLITRSFDSSTAALAEMIVRGEHDRLLYRFRSLVGLAIAGSVAAALIFVSTNQPFVYFWTSGRIGWPVLNDVLLGVWLVLLVMSHVYSSLAFQIKSLGRMPYVFLAQGAVFVCATWLFAVKLDFAEIPAMLVTAVATTLGFSVGYGIWRTGRYFEVPSRVIAFGWMAGPAKLILLGVPLAAALCWITEPLANWSKLSLRVVGTAIPLALLFLRMGLDVAVRGDVLHRTPALLQRPLRFIFGAARSEGK